MRGPQVFAGYWDRPDATAEAFVDGWFRTGDVAVHEPDGYRLLGRSSVDIIKTGGEKVSALEIEEVYRTHPDVADCAVVGLDDDEWGERVCAAVVPRTGVDVDADALRAWGKERLAAGQGPVAVRVRRRPPPQHPRQGRQARRQVPLPVDVSPSECWTPDAGAGTLRWRGTLGWIVHARSATRSTGRPRSSRSTGPSSSTPSPARCSSELLEAFDRADADDAVRAVIVTGAGRAFCAGADLSAGGDTFDLEARGVAGRRDRARPRDGGGILTLRIFESTKPVIGAINGSAVGVGISMTLPMDIRILADHAKVGFVFAGRGIAPDGAASWFLPAHRRHRPGAGVGPHGPRLPGPGGARRRARAQHPPGRRGARRRPRRWPRRSPPTPRRCRPAVSRGLLWRMLGARPPDGRPPRRLGGDLRPRPQARRPGGRDRLPREAPAGVDAQPDHGPPADLPVVGQPDVRGRVARTTG